VEALKCFDQNLIKSAYNHSFKLSEVYVNGSLRAQVPRESVYDTELTRILCIWLRTSGWSFTGQLHIITDDRRHKYSDIVIQSPDDKPIVFELVATGEPSFLEAHIKKTPEYMTLSSAVEGWVVHFTCEDSFIPTWQTDAELSGGVNVIHISYTEDFTNLKLYIRSKNRRESMIYLFSHFYGCSYLRIHNCCKCSVILQTVLKPTDIHCSMQRHIVSITVGLNPLTLSDAILRYTTCA